MIPLFRCPRAQGCISILQQEPQPRHLLILFLKKPHHLSIQMKLTYIGKIKSHCSVLTSDVDTIWLFIHMRTTYVRKIDFSCIQYADDPETVSIVFHKLSQLARLQVKFLVNKTRRLCVSSSHRTYLGSRLVGFKDIHTVDSGESALPNQELRWEVTFMGES